MLHPTLKSKLGRALLHGVLVLLAGSACDRENPNGDTDEVPDLLGILVSPDRVIIPLGDQIQLTATGLLEDRSSVDVTNVVAWGSEAGAIAQVSDGLDEEGVIFGLSEGETTVWAQLDEVQSVPVSVTVTGASLLGLTVIPPAVSVEVGKTVQLKAEAAFSDGSRADASAQVLWATDNGSIATLASGGRLTGVGAGSTDIHAEWDGLRSELVPVTVLQQARSDLRVAGVQAEAGPDDITLTVTVENTGNVGASDFWVDVFLDPAGAPSPGDFGDYYEPVWYLGDGETDEVAFNFPAAPGNHTVWVVIDTDDEVSESNESNNTFSHPITVTSVASGPNLSISYFDYYADNTSILYAVDVYNGGGTAVGSFYVDVWVHSEDDPTDTPADQRVGDDWTEVLGLDPGESDSADFLLTEWCDYCWSWVMVDTNDDVVETNENDNLEGPIEVESPL